MKRQQKECESSVQLVTLYAKRFGAGQWSFLGPGSGKKWHSISEDSAQGKWDRIAEQMMLTFAGSGHQVLRSTSPLSRQVLKSKGGGKLSVHYCAEPGTIETVFRKKISVNQLSIYGAVAENVCKNVSPAMIEQGDLLWKDNVTHSSCQVWWRHTYLWPMIPAHQEEDLLQRDREQIEKSSQQDRVSKFCTDTGFLTTVEVRQYFMTERHWRILTIHRFRCLSWAHFAKRRKFIWT